MRKRKGDERKQTLDTKIHPVVRLCTKPLLLHVVEALYREYLFSATKSFPRLFLPRHQDFKSQWSSRPWVPLRNFSTKDGGLYVLRINLSTPLHTKTEGRIHCRRATRTPRGRHTKYMWWLSPTTKTQGTQPCSLTHSLKS